MALLLARGCLCEAKTGLGGGGLLGALLFLGEEESADDEGGGEDGEPGPKLSGIGFRKTFALRGEAA